MSEAAGRDGESVDAPVGAQDAASAGGGPGEPMGLEARIRRLEEIVSQLEADVELERALALFEEGVGHVREAEALIARTELRVEELLGRGAEQDVVPLEDPDA